MGYSPKTPLSYNCTGYTVILCWLRPLMSPLPIFLFWFWTVEKTIPPLVLPWYLYKMVAQNTLRRPEGKQVPFNENKLQIWSLLPTLSNSLNRSKYLINSTCAHRDLRHDLIHVPWGLCLCVPPFIFHRALYCCINLHISNMYKTCVYSSLCLNILRVFYGSVSYWTLCGGGHTGSV